MPFLLLLSDFLVISLLLNYYNLEMHNFLSLLLFLVSLHFPILYSLAISGSLFSPFLFPILHFLYFYNYRMGLGFPHYSSLPLPLSHLLVSLYLSDLYNLQMLIPLLSSGFLAISLLLNYYNLEMHNSLSLLFLPVSLHFPILYSPAINVSQFSPFLFPRPHFLYFYNYRMGLGFLHYSSLLLPLLLLLVSLYLLVLYNLQMLIPLLSSGFLAISLLLNYYNLEMHNSLSLLFLPVSLHFPILYSLATSGSQSSPSPFLILHFLYFYNYRMDLCLLHYSILLSPLSHPPVSLYSSDLGNFQTLILPVLLNFLVILLLLNYYNY